MRATGIFPPQALRASITCASWMLPSRRAPKAASTTRAHWRQRLPRSASGNLLLAAEGFHNDGPWTVPEDLSKANLVLRYGQGQRDDGWAVSLLGYDAKWNATDQIAQRAMDMVGRYGSLDPTSGGTTHRNSLSAEFARSGNNGISRVNAYYIDYALDLWSNFTYAIDQVHGDQFLQHDQRGILGGSATHSWAANFDDKFVETTIGADLRRDDIRNGQFLTQNRTVWGKVRDDSIRQTSAALWGESQIQWNEKFRSILGLRGDGYQFEVNSDNAANSGSKNQAIVSPKLALVFGPWDKTEYYLNAGAGFHSNDARGTTVTVNTDPRPGARPACTGPVGACTGDPVSRVDPLVRAKGYELGVRTAQISGLQSTLTLWRLELDSELVFVGDAGTTSASRPSRRQGVEWANYWKPNAWLLVDGDVSLSSARFTDADPAGNHIPGAVEQVASLGVSLPESDPVVGGPAPALLRPQSPRRRQQRAFEIVHPGQRLGRLSPQQATEGQHGSAESVQRPGERHRLLLRFATARRGGAGERCSHAPGRTENHASDCEADSLRQAL